MRRVLLVLLVPVLVTALGACGHRGSARQAVSATTQAASPAQRQGPLGVVPMPLAIGPAHLELTALSRTSGNTVTGQLRIVNDGAGELDLSGTLNDINQTQITDRPPSAFEISQAQDPNAQFASGIGLLDGTGNKLYMPLRTTHNQCLCSDLSKTVVPPSGSAEVYAVFPAPPAEVGRVTVTVPHAVPIQDVPLATGPVQPLKDQTIDPASAALAPPRILPVRSTVEGQEQSTDDTAGDRAIRLSSDVLFALNKADLTPRASALLEGVARQIDQSTSSTVKVDGYTDITGNDAINQPLSQRRAQAVSQRLRSLVRRQGVTFQVAGHGSQDPVAPNNTEEGRRKNRRTTVTFTRPSPKPTATPPASGGQPFRLSPGEPLTVAGRASFTPPEAAGLKVELNSLHRDPSGVTTLVWTLRNDASQLIDIGARFSSSSFTTLDVNSASGVELVDTSGRLRYRPLHASDGRCLCAEFIRYKAKGQLAPADTVTYADTYELPPELRTVDLQIPWSNSPGATMTGLTVK